jgi:hypothetical protein
MVLVAAAARFDDLKSTQFFRTNRIVVHLIKEIRFVRSTVPLCRNGRTSFLCAFLQMKAKALAQ